MSSNAAVVRDARRAQGFGREDQQFYGTVINGDKPSVRRRATLMSAPVTGFGCRPVL